MDPYLFQGVVLPERAQLTVQFGLGFEHLGSGVKGVANVSIINNQIAVWVATDREWDVFDLRNLVRNIVQNDLAIIGFLKGYAYDIELTRVTNQSRNVDHVFGIDIPCIAERGKAIDLATALSRLREKTTGPNGVYLNRCVRDLVSAMKDAEDTGFYCYRAIESLRHHCAAVNSVSNADKAEQWEAFRRVAGSTEDDLRFVKVAADPLRHGQPGTLSGKEREELFLRTWQVVDSYLARI
jgi:hypothetical protein